MLSALALERVKETSEAIRCQREREKRTYLGVIDPQLAFLELLCHVALSSILELSQHLLKPECFIFECSHFVFKNGLSSKEAIYYGLKSVHPKFIC